ncbi:MAG: iron export ABC transporter permease subunit FetB [Candidatus Marinimicrobia bacterium]|nr:iron export ABC transporter permease subunit FetB [Candidatus Neomarinimicrobiota bacterium]
MTQPYDLSFTDVLLSLLLMALAIAVARLKGLGIEKSLALGTVRTFVQLTLIGYALNFLFLSTSLSVFAAVALAMLAVAAWEAVRRQQVRIPRFYLIAFVSLSAALALSTAVVVALIIRPEPWHSLVITIPLTGMVLGNSLNVISLSADRFLSELRLRRDEVETALSLAAPPSQALHPVFKSAVSSALIPAINALMTVGLVQLPGVMTGQILAGTPPMEAIKIQIVIMMMWIATGVVSGVISTTLLSRQLVNRRWQVRWELLPGD